MKYAVYVDVFTVWLDDLTRKQQRDDLTVARVLAEHGRFSIFEATANQVVARTMTRIQESGWFVFDHESVGYPWTLVTLTDLGKQVLDHGGKS